MAKDEEEIVPLEKKNRKRPLSHRMVFSFSVFVSTAATIISIVASIGFGTFFYRGLSGFSRQVNAFVQIGDFGMLFGQVLIVIFTALFILYLLFVYLSAVKAIKIIPCCGSPFILFLTSCGSHAFLIFWSLVMCMVSSVTLVYFLFIGGIYSFCALLNQQCFDFKVLIPAIMSRFSNKKVDMVFCEEKKELLCSAANNQIWTFAIAFIFALITFAGSLAVQNCVVYGLGRKTTGKYKGEAYQMNTRNARNELVEKS